MPHMGYNGVLLLAQRVCSFEYLFESLLAQKRPEWLRVVVEYLKILYERQTALCYTCQPRAVII